MRFTVSYFLASLCQSATCSPSISPTLVSHLSFLTSRLSSLSVSPPAPHLAFRLSPPVSYLFITSITHHVVPHILTNYLLLTSKPLSFRPFLFHFPPLITPSLLPPLTSLPSPFDTFRPLPPASMKKHPPRASVSRAAILSLLSAAGGRRQWLMLAI